MKKRDRCDRCLRKCWGLLCVRCSDQLGPFPVRMPNLATADDEVVVNDPEHVGATLVDGYELLHLIEPYDSPEETES